ncbi:aminotransferase class I/II-fold pyridoxal phosphate-dependent enzyme [Actinoplanes palleronii]|uniref:Aminotransferase class I/classII large domain-containing protein n=1 Tax=Actinoplanes palleronii TaxID=113570 RepID=A0ABQ4B6L6_9ACTN|nr:aminotransferase class I/II-fold pyridoxal phosphate-dependent enzyme [Actinoplanes palleronii]GIE66299.1 hypothetical protein Apa02nite_024070 [Actinoplanes palleronii]
MEIDGQEILRLHQDIDMQWRRIGEGKFLSGWETVNPFEYVPHTYSADQMECYDILSEAADLATLIQDFHANADGIEIAPNSIYMTNGSSPLLLTIFLFAQAQGITEIFYVPPIYYSCYYFAQRLGIRLTPISTMPLHGDADLRLPTERSTLLFCDPIWMAGTKVHEKHFDRIRDWQADTGSLVFVDGTFQYTQWDQPRAPEQTSRLLPDLTVRLVCPTKSLAVHGVRFAYLIYPERFKEDIRYPCSNITGSTSTIGYLQAVAIMKALNSAEGNALLTGHIARQHRRLLSDGLIGPEMATPNASYFTFAVVGDNIRRECLTMDERHFGLHGWPGYIRVNLLSPYWETIAGSSASRI